MHLAEPVEGSLVGQQRKGARSAGYDDDVGSGHVVVAVGGVDDQAHVGVDGAGMCGDEACLGAG